MLCIILVVVWEKPCHAVFSSPYPQVCQWVTVPSSAAAYDPEMIDTLSMDFAAVHNHIRLNLSSIIL
jgi:hypothetical protein